MRSARLVLVSLMTAVLAGDEGLQVLIAASREHYVGLLAVVASAAHYTKRRRIHFMVAVAPGELSIGSALQCAAVKHQVTVREFSLDGWPATTRISTLSAKRRLAEPLNFARFFVADLFTEGRVIYLDSDVLVLADLALLDRVAAAGFRKNPDAALAVVPRDFKKVCGHVVHCDAAAQYMNATPEELNHRLQAFNAGVIVFDLFKYRKLHLKDTVAFWIRMNLDTQRIYDLGSNPPLVLAVADNYVRLDTKWNCLRGLRKQHTHNTVCWKRAFIRHFPGDAKPWELASAKAQAIGWLPPPFLYASSPDQTSISSCQTAVYRLGVDPLLFTAPPFSSRGFDDASAPTPIH